MDALLRALGGKDRDLTIAILKALEQVGNEKALPIVERLAAGWSLWSDGWVRCAAEECLPALRQRAEQSRMANTLLRPAAAPGNEAEVLLRPAGNVESRGEILLRPSQREK